MIVFIKVQAASILGSFGDYLTTIGLVGIIQCHYLLANLAGNCVGGSLQFLLCRKWAFHAKEGRVSPQIIKFILVFAGNLLLSAGSVYLLTSYLGINYVVSKTVSSVLLGVSYNYILQKKFVFPTVQ